MNGQKSEKAILRRELVNLWTAAIVSLNACMDIIGILVGEKQCLKEELCKVKDVIKNQAVEITDLNRHIAVHENYNNPSSEVTLFAKKRKQYRRTTKEASGVISNISDLEAQDHKRKRGKKKSSHWTTPRYMPDGSKDSVEYKQHICGKCGRGTNVVFSLPIIKIVRDIGECGKAVCYYEIIVTAHCDVYKVITWPATESIPRTSTSSTLRGIILNIRELAPTPHQRCS